MLCSRFLNPSSEERHSAIYDASERVFNKMLGIYDKALEWSLNHRRLVIILSGINLMVTIYLFIAIPKGFIPSEDRSAIFAFTQAAEGISVDAMMKHQQAVAAEVRKDPDVKSFFSTMGARGSRSSNTGVIFMHLKPRSERKYSADQIIERLRPKLAKIPGIMAFLQNLPPIQIGGHLTKAQYQVTLQGADTGELYKFAPIFETKMHSLEGLHDITSDLEIKNPQVTVEIDRNKAAAMGVTAEAIENTLYYAYGSREISTIYTRNNTYQVIMEVETHFKRDPSALSLLYVRSQDGQLVPLKTIANITQDLGPLSINHTGQAPSVTLSFNLNPEFPLSKAISQVENLARKTLPASISTSFQGTAEAFRSSVTGLGLLLLMAILVIYMVLGILYESFIHPITILSALPFAGFGALVTLLLFRIDLSIYAFVGIIMLVGLVKKNGIIMIDFALEAERKEGKGPVEAIHEACIVRFRPIMMTTMAALMGTLPIALGFGAGAESRRPLGLAVVGGLLFSQFLTLVVTPVFYVYMDEFQSFLSRRFKRGGKKE